MVYIDSGFGFFGSFIIGFGGFVLLDKGFFLGLFGGVGGFDIGLVCVFGIRVFRNE